MTNRDSLTPSVRDSISSTSRFSSLLSPTSTPSTTTTPRSSSSTFPIPQPSPSLPPLPPNLKRTSIIYDRPLPKARGTEVALGAWAFLFSEIIQYTQKRVSGIGEFEKRLNILGYRVGSRLLELLPLRDYLYPISSLRSPPPPTRTLRLLPILSYVHSTLYRYLFGRPADSLERSTDNEDEYMIGDDDMVVTRGVEVPKEMSELSCGALVAGIVEAVMDGAGFPARVTAHSVPSVPHPRRTVILIKLDPEVLAREAALGGK
ncbi:NO signaling/Golgi transport ligand-binding domain-containing protein [Leucosporidium creatinivorum]|uniref:Trafficking protein particle complex subunit n=1 Tax=Leucosporidium creatinivorum TaxID=106004 RepID=A0A1Y2FY06_9BASI|nr:NO signaling/Golgi transport ligand-binding domain-containing protein [Leucosporidium creatinivorum]